jgi:hypothetical protein
MNQTYYKQDCNKFSFGELKRHSPNVFAFPGLCLMKLFGLLPTAPTFAPMPAKPCFVEFEQLSARCRGFIEPSIESFQRLGFEILGCEINADCHNPNYIDGAGCHLVHTVRNYVAMIAYHNFVEVQPPPSEFSNLTVWAAFEENYSIALANHKFISYFYDKVSNRQSFYCDASSPFQMLPIFEKLVETYAAGDAIMPIRTVRDLSSLFETQGRKLLEAGLKNGRFVPMSELEIIKMKQDRIDKLSAIRDRFQDATTVRL